MGSTCKFAQYILNALVAIKIVAVTEKLRQLSLITIIRI